MNDIEILEHYLEMEEYENKEEFLQAIENLLENSKKIIELNYIPKSKVKEKIEELEKERKRKDEEDIINPFYDQIDITHIIEVLQELLEKE